MQTPDTRLKALRQDRGFSTATDAAKAFGWTVVTYRSHENGTRKISYDAAKRYATAFRSSASYILEGRRPTEATVNDVTSVTLTGVVSAGVFVEPDGEEDESTMIPAIPRKDVPSDKQYALRISGPSVNKKIADGAYAICAPLDSYPGGAPHGALVHVVRERAGLYEHTIKEVHYLKDRVVLMPCSTDKRFQEPIEIDGDDEAVVRIQGVVIGSFQPF